VLASLKAAAQRLIAPLPKSAPDWIRELAQASDQFIVRRGKAGAGALQHHRRLSVVRRLGPRHHDFAARPRDGLGRYDIAAGILKTYAGFVDRGMLPNRFPDGGEAPEYNTADATLWMFHALDDYLQARPIRSCSANCFRP
jgi:hypothetical protein